MTVRGVVTPIPDHVPVPVPVSGQKSQHKKKSVAEMQRFFYYTVCKILFVTE